ncbi:MAG: MBOAT family protein [Deltaproteobacteria bacterium]|nr:MBOAT family protein [Deltaproteobacteria bacterium]
MVFSSVTFLFFFLPLVLAIYLILPLRGRNVFLMLASLLFYTWGEAEYVGIMVVSIASNYVCGRLLGRTSSPRKKRRVLIGAVAINLGLLGAFKYANFLADNLNHLLAAAGIGTLDIPQVHLPIGISFFTFQALSYVIDVYRGQSEVQRSPIKLALFVSLFPQLIAGPIVRYHQVAEQITHRIVNCEKFQKGIQRFIIGLAKKVLIANTLAVTADQIFKLDPTSLPVATAWLGVICYTFQIYFDFSGYSDMAIGLGRMLGFDFPENFNYPYVAKSVREFWRRWHISLSTWFRDYLYIPLGGNRHGAMRTYVNLVLVFFLCGLWHGAVWTFVVWGLYHGIFLALERTAFGQVLDRSWRPLRHIYTVLVFGAGWVVFRAETLTQAGQYYASLMGFADAPDARYGPGTYANPLVILVLLLGLVCSLPVLPILKKWLTAERHETTRGLVQLVSSVTLLLLLLLCVLPLASGTYNPFIYFRF